MPSQGGSWVFWVVIIAALVVFLFLPQWMAQRRRRKREEDLAVGDNVLTIGGLMGELTYLDTESNLARIRIADGVEIQILPGAISGKRAPSMEPETTDDPVDESNPPES